MDMKVDRNKVKVLRLKKSWSQERLAEEASVSLRTIQRMELDGSASLNSRRTVATALGVEPVNLDREEIDHAGDVGCQMNTTPEPKKKNLFKKLFHYPGPSYISKKFQGVVLVILWLLTIVTGASILFISIPLTVVNALNPDELLSLILVAQIPSFIIFVISLGLYLFFRRLSPPSSH